VPSPIASWRAVLKRFDALIIGGGPAGATAALSLSKAGWRVAVIEKSAFPRRKVCGEFISATTLPLLFDLGIGEAFTASAGPEIRKVGLFEGDTILEAPMPEIASEYGAYGRALGRDRLDALLLDAAAKAGAILFQPAKAIAAEKRDGWRVTLESESGLRELAAPIVIAANGSWERGPFPPESEEHRDSDLLAFKAHFRDFDLAPDLMPLLVFPGGYGGLVTSDNGRLSLSCCIRRDTLRGCRQRTKERAGDAVISYIKENCRGFREATERATLDGAILAAGPIRPGIRLRYRDKVFFIGNAAGEAHPIIAEGISMAIQSAALLCRQLIARKDYDAAGEAYSSDWAGAFSLRIQSASVFAHLAMRPKANAIVRPLLRTFPSLLTLGARFAGKARRAA
jgi:menaquinone-9 beta-reductase